MDLHRSRRAEGGSGSDIGAITRAASELAEQRWKGRIPALTRRPLTAEDRNFLARHPNVARIDGRLCPVHGFL